MKGDYGLDRLTMPDMEADHCRGFYRRPARGIKSRQQESVLSRELREKMKGRFEKKEQVMLFLNRRDTRVCFLPVLWTCDEVSALRCFSYRSIIMKGFYAITVDMRQENPGICRCADRLISVASRPERSRSRKVVREAFAGVRTFRMDFDTTRTRAAMKKILAAFAAHEADVLIGTQMIVKGHDFPDVTRSWCCSERIFH